MRSARAQAGRPAVAAGYVLVGAAMGFGAYLESPALVGATAFLGVALTALLHAPFVDLHLKATGVDLLARGRVIQDATEDLESVAVAAVEVASDAPTGGEESESDRRQAIESLMAESARWGWTMAQVGFSSPPEPHIEWNLAGAPEILFGTTTEADDAPHLTSTGLRLSLLRLMHASDEENEQIMSALRHIERMQLLEAARQRRREDEAGSDAR